MFDLKFQTLSFYKFLKWLKFTYLFCHSLLFHIWDIIVSFHVFSQHTVHLFFDALSCIEIIMIHFWQFFNFIVKIFLWTKRKLFNSRGAHPFVLVVFF